MALPNENADALPLLLGAPFYNTSHLREDLAYTVRCRLDPFYTLGERLSLSLACSPLGDRPIDSPLSGLASLFVLRLCVCSKSRGSKQRLRSSDRPSPSSPWFSQSSRRTNAQSTLGCCAGALKVAVVVDVNNDDGDDSSLVSHALGQNMSITVV